MKAKRFKRPFPAVKTALEFVIILSAAMVLFSIIDFLGGFDRLYELPAQQHEGVYKCLLITAFLAAALLVCSVRKLLEVRKAYKKLAQSEEQLRFQSVLLDEIGDGITATDFEGNITYVNKAQCDRVKRDRSELLGQSTKIYGEDSELGTTQKELIQTTLEKGRWSGEIVNTASDGRKITVECHTWLMKDKDGKPTGMCGVARDITEKKLQERNISKHRRYLEALDKTTGILLNSITELKYDEFLAALGPASDADRVHIFLKPADEANVPLRQKTQWCRSEKIQPVPTKLTEKRFLADISPQWQKVLATGKHLCFSKDNFPPEQLDFWESLNIKALLIVPIKIDGQLSGFMSFDNCTEARQWTESEIDFLSTAANNLAMTTKRLDIKKELKQQRDFAQRLIETAQTIVLVLDANADIVTFNPYFEKLTGYKLDEVKGKNWFNTFLPEEDRQKINQIFKKAINEICIDGNVNPIVIKDGRLKQIEWYARTLRDEQAQVVGILSTGQDITERLKAEEELKQAHLELEQRVIQRTAALQQVNTQLLRTIEEKDHIQKVLQETEKLAGAGKLAAQIAHEINNPLAGIKNSFLLLKDAIPSDYKYFEYVGRIEKEIARVSNIVQQMFELYRPGTHPADKFDVREVIGDIIELLRTAGREKCIHIEISCPDDIVATLPEALFRQVMYNLIQNAVQFSPSKGTIKIAASKTGSKLKIEVSDEGPGVDEKIRQKIFEPFFTTGTSTSGLGLGLSITKDIINAMEGKIHFENRSPKGTTFTILIPIINESKA